MKNLNLLLLLLVTISGRPLLASESLEPCSQEWYQYVEQQLVSGDGQGHGPDLGSNEWKGVVEFKLGIRDQPDLPARDSGEWCELIDRLLSTR